MATLFNTKISATYEGLLKTIDNAVITATLRELTDGSGNQSGLFLNTAGDFKVTSVLEWGSLKDTGTGVTITQFVTAANGIENFNNDTTLPTSAAVKLYVDTKFSQTDTLTEVLGFGNTTSGKDIAVSAGDDVTFTDTSKAIFGLGSDLSIFHNGTDSFISDTGTGDFNIQGSENVYIKSSTGEVSARFVSNSSVKLFYDNVQKFQTTSLGIEINGNAIVGGTGIQVASGNVTFVDNGKAIFGASSDFQIYHSGSASLIEDLGTGDLNITSNGSGINLQKGQTAYLARFYTDGANELYYSGSKKIETVTAGAKVTGNLEVTGTITGVGGSFLPLAGGTMTGVGGVIYPDGFPIKFGTSQNLEIKSVSNVNFISALADKPIKISTNSLFIQNQALSKNYITAIDGGAVELYFNNLKKIETTNTGVTITGGWVTTGVSVATANVEHTDNTKSTFGNGNDLEIYHDSTNNIIKSNSGQFNIDQGAVTQSIVFKTSDTNALDTTALIINRSGDLITGRDVTIAGDLTVNGTTTTVNSQTLSVKDPLISLATANAANSLDIGFYGKYNDGTTRYQGLFNDASDSNKFKLFKGLTVEPTTTVNIGGTGYVAADLVVAGLEAGNVTFTDLLLGSGEYLSWGSEGVTSIEGSTVSNKLSFRTQSVERLLLNAAGATFSSDVTINGAEYVNQIQARNSSGLTLGNQSNSGFIFINNAGNTGIGTATPAEKLHVNGEVRVDGNDGVATKKIRSSYFSDNQNLLLESGASADIILTSSKVGIGITNPLRKLELKNITGGRNFGIGFNDKDSIQQGTIAIDHNTNDLITATTANMRFFSGSTIGGIAALPTNERMCILSNGKVGIGTTTPLAKLHVKDGSVLSSALGNTSALIEGFNQSILQIASHSTGYSQIAFGDQDDGFDGGFIYSNASRFLSIEIANAERMRILTNGNVGIGTTTPTATLHVDGSSGSTAIFRGATQSTINLQAGSTNNFLVGAAAGGFSFRPNGTTALTLDASQNATFTGQINATGEASNGGTINIGDTPAYRGVLSYSGAGNSILSIANTFNSLTSQINFNLRTAASSVTALSLKGSGEANFAGGIKLPDNSFLTWSTSNTRIVGQSAYIQFQVGGADKMRLTSAGDVAIQTAGKGLVLKSPNGTEYKITVANDGTITSTAV